jgi:hypothetical protein
MFALAQLRDTAMECAFRPGFEVTPMEDRGRENSDLTLRSLELAQTQQLAKQSKQVARMCRHQLFL